jgi:hypothetical protein
MTVSSLVWDLYDQSHLHYPSKFPKSFCISIDSPYKPTSIFVYLRSETSVSAFLRDFASLLTHLGGLFLYRMKNSHWSDEAKWIWLPDYNDTAASGQMVLFRKTFNLASIPDEQCLLRVSADTRYRLFVNGVSVSFGPCKSYLERWYYEVIDIAPFLRNGLNVIHARVLRFSNAHPGSLSLMRGPFPGFILYCIVDVSQANHGSTVRKLSQYSIRVCTQIVRGRFAETSPCRWYLDQSGTTH